MLDRPTAGMLAPGGAGMLNPRSAMGGGGDPYAGMSEGELLQMMFGLGAPMPSQPPPPPVSNNILNIQGLDQLGNNTGNPQQLALLLQRLMDRR
jgi:hypothetical protein